MTSLLLRYKLFYWLIHGVDLCLKTLLQHICTYFRCNIIMSHSGTVLLGFFTGTCWCSSAKQQIWWRSQSSSRTAAVASSAWRAASPFTFMLISCQRVLLKFLPSCECLITSFILWKFWLLFIHEALKIQFLGLEWGKLWQPNIKSNAGIIYLPYFLIQVSVSETHNLNLKQLILIMT